MSRRSPPPDLTIVQAVRELRKTGLPVYLAAVADHPDRIPRRDERDLWVVGPARMSTADMLARARGGALQAIRPLGSDQPPLEAGSAQQAPEPRRKGNAVTVKTERRFANGRP